MPRGLAILVGVAMLLGASRAPALAKVYRWVDRQGIVTYADRPPQSEETAAVPAEPAAPAASQPRRPVHPAAEVLLELAGVKRQVPAIAERARANMIQGMGPLTAGDKSAAYRVTGLGFQPQLLYGLIKEEFSQHIDDTRVTEALGWYRTPLAQRVANLEVAFTTAANRERDLTQFVARLRVEQPDPRRLALIQRLDVASGATETSLDLILAIAQAIARVADPYLPADRRLKAGPLESRARQLRLQSQEMLHQANALSMLYVYRSLEDADIARYIQFLESEAGSWFSSAVRKAMVTAFATAIERTARDLVRAVPVERWGQDAEVKKPALPTPGERL
jgi:hypothetical protein